MESTLMTILTLNARLNAENADLKQQLAEIALKLRNQTVVCKQCHAPANIAELLGAAGGVRLREGGCS